MSGHRERVLTVLGTRPEIIRLSRVIPLLDRHCDHTLVHTGQNSGDELSGVFFRDLGLRAPDKFLGVDTSSLGNQLGSLFQAFEPVLDAVRPTRLVVLGDTNSGLTALLAKRRGVQVVHLEAGNRCYDDRVPEEVNRRVIDHSSDVLLPYTHRSAANLEREGVDRSRIFVIGNPIFEVLEHYKARIAAATALRDQGVQPRQFLLATMHRAENVDHPEKLKGLCGALREIADLFQMPLILSVHPRLAVRMAQEEFAGSRVRPLPALPFFDFVALERSAALVISDSGTVQEECAIFQVPVITMRDVTERPETLEAGGNLLGSTDPARLVGVARYLLDRTGASPYAPPPEYVEPSVADKVVRLVLGVHRAPYLAPSR